MAFRVAGREATSTLTIEFTSGAGSTYRINADSTPTLTVSYGGAVIAYITDPTNTSTGVYDAKWTPSVSGEYALLWNFLVSTASYQVEDTVFALTEGASADVGSGSPTRTTLTNHAKVQLGYPSVCVELDDTAFEDAAVETELWMAVHMGQLKRTTLALVSGTSVYDMPSDCEYVTDIAFPQQWSGTLPLPVDLDGLEDFYYGRFFGYGGKGGGFNSAVYQNLQYIDMTQRTLSADPDHRWDFFDKKLTVSPLNSVSGTAFVWYLSNVMDYTRLSLQQRHLMRRYMVAQCMMILGRIRSKYSEVPGSGGKITLNGSDLISSAENEFMTLEEKVKALVEPMGFITG